jgi:hypothetical protein
MRKEEECLSSGSCHVFELKYLQLFRLGQPDEFSGRRILFAELKKKLLQLNLQKIIELRKMRT